MIMGHSRVPVYYGNPTNIIGLVLVISFLCKLSFYDSFIFIFHLFIFIPWSCDLTSHCPIFISENFWWLSFSFILVAILLLTTVVCILSWETRWWIRYEQWQWVVVAWLIVIDNQMWFSWPKRSWQLSWQSCFKESQISVCISNLNLCYNCLFMLLVIPWG